MADRIDSSEARTPPGPVTIQSVVDTLMGYNPEKIILFGSAARGDADEYSDIDLIVIKQTKRRFMQRLVDVTAYLPPNTRIDALVYTPKEFRQMVEGENPFIEGVLEDARVLYEKNPGADTWVLASSLKDSGGEGSRFVKKPLETARRWLAQAEHSLVTTRTLLENNLLSDTCFHSEQTAQLALKAFLYSLRRRFVTIHSVRELASLCAQEDADFSPFVEYGTYLDRYYLTTRYPDALPEPALPFESFTEREAQQAFAYATEIIDLLKAKVPAGS